MFRDFAITLLSILPLSITTMVSAESLASYQWKNRILIIFPNAGESISQEFLNPKPRDQTRINDLKLKIIKNDSRELQKKLSLNPDVKGALIGLDGGVKQTWSKAFSLDDVEVKINQMPMRQRELLNRSD